MLKRGLLRRFAPRNDDCCWDQPQTTLSSPGLTGRSSTLRLLVSITDVSGILDHPPSRVMTAVVWRAARLLPHRLLQPRHRHAFARQLIGALVFGVAGVALDPVPAHLMRFQRGIEPLPQFDILDRLLVGGAPAVFLPAVDPA